MMIKFPAWAFRAINGTSTTISKSVPVVPKSRLDIIVDAVFNHAFLFPSNNPLINKCPI